MSFIQVAFGSLLCPLIGCCLRAGQKGKRIPLSEGDDTSSQQEQKQGQSQWGNQPSSSQSGGAPHSLVICSQSASWLVG